MKSKNDLLPCTCVVAGMITACRRHDATATFGFPMSFDPENYGTVGFWPRDPSHRPENRVVHAEAHLTIVKPAPAVPFSGPPGDLFALTHHIDIQPTTEQWQTLKRLILSLERT